MPAIGRGVDRISEKIPLDAEPKPYEQHQADGNAWVLLARPGGARQARDKDRMLILLAKSFNRLFAGDASKAGGSELQNGV
jgi:hypothetical protein